MDNQDKKKVEDIFEDIKPIPIVEKEKEIKKELPLKDVKILSNKFSSNAKSSKKGSKNLFILIIRLLIILAIIIAVGFLLLYLWNKFENRTFVEPADNTTSTPSVVSSIETKEKPLDTDADGLTDIEEKQLKTRIDNPDTDNDGLSDRLEVNVYFTNPLRADTDRDGIQDGEEVRRGLDPDNSTVGAKLFDLKKEIKELE